MRGIALAPRIRGARQGSGSPWDRRHSLLPGRARPRKGSRRARISCAARLPRASTGDCASAAIDGSRSALPGRRLEERVAEGPVRLRGAIEVADPASPALRFDQAFGQRALADALDHRGERPSREALDLARPAMVTVKRWGDTRG